MTEIGDVEDARRYCKLHFGVPIMRKVNEDFRNAWNVSFLLLTYETKLELMGPCALFGPDGFPVTRLFDRAQGIQYTDRIVAEFSGKGVVFDDLLGPRSHEDRKQQVAAVGPRPRLHFAPAGHLPARL